MSKKMGLETEYGQSVVLKSMHLEGRIEGLLLTMKSRQTYLNDTGETIEASYTFSAGWGVNLMGLNVELNGKRMQAVVLEKRKAERKYEKAIEAGDTPVMFEKSAHGLVTANLGNLKPGEEAVIEFQYAQLLRFEKGRTRVTIPTVIGERYGDEVGLGQVAPHQTTETDLLAEYPFTAVLNVTGELSAGTITCPSHQVQIETVEEGVNVHLREGGVLDRDFVVSIEDVAGKSFATVSEDDGAWAVIASFCPSLEEQVPAPLALKILVDCSGSMQGDSIEQAQEAMHELILRLSESDMLSYSRFGDDVVHTSNRLERCDSQYVRNVLAKAVHETAANLGGTQLQKALKSTFKLSFQKAYSEGCDLLLITDGDVWDIDEIVNQSKRSNHRIFAIGVGSAPAESLLRDVAELTGGACELVTPGESIADAVLRMTKRMRSARTSSIEIQWGDEVLWQSKLPKQVFSDETIHVFGRLSTKPITAPTLKWNSKGVSGADSPNLLELNATGSLPRMVAAAQLEVTGDASEAIELGLKYQLSSKYTNLILVHVREENDKARGLPKLQKIKQMQAAGWGGLGTVQRSERVYACLSSAVNDSNQPDYGIMAVPSVWRTNRTQAAAKVDQLAAGGMDDYEIPAFRRKQEEIPEQSPSDQKDRSSPEELIRKLNKLTAMSMNFSEIVQSLQSELSGESILQVLHVMTMEGVTLDQAWACLFGWLSKTVQHASPLTRHSERVLKNALSNVSTKMLISLETILQDSYPKINANFWGRIYANEDRTLLGKLKELIVGH